MSNSETLHILHYKAMVGIKKIYKPTRREQEKLSDLMYDLIKEAYVYGKESDGRDINRR